MHRTFLLDESTRNSKVKVHNHTPFARRKHLHSVLTSVGIKTFRLLVRALVTLHSQTYVDIPAYIFFFYIWSEAVLHDLGFHPIKGNLPARAYSDILENSVLPTLWQQSRKEPVLVQHDNALIHKTRTLKKHFLRPQPHPTSLR